MYRNALICLLLGASCTGESFEGARGELRAVPGGFSGLRMYVYEPASPAANAPLVVALHGCTQSAADYRGAGWEALADEHGFYVLYAEQPSANNRCFTWWEPFHTSRGSGEAGAIAAMVAQAKTDYVIDDSRVFVTGLSAGGAMAAAMAATYPDVFAAGAIMAGIPYRCASAQSQAFSCMFSQQSVSREEWARRVLRAGPSGATPARMSIWHGTSDFTVRPFNGDALVDQWTAVHGVDAVPELVETVDGEERRVHQNALGEPVVEQWFLTGMGHGTAVDPRNGCGRAGAFLLDRGTCSSRYAAEFFGLLEMTSDAGVPDAGDFDTGPADSGVDLGPLDTGVDLGSPDMGVLVDTGVDSGPVDAGAVDSGIADSGTEDSGAFACTSVNDSNYAHEQAGRGYRCDGGYVCATGSGERMGLWNLFFRTTLAETAPGYYVVGECPGDG